MQAWANCAHPAAAVVCCKNRNIMTKRQKTLKNQSVRFVPPSQGSVRLQRARAGRFFIIPSIRNSKAGRKNIVEGKAKEANKCSQNFVSALSAERAGEFENSLCLEMSKTAGDSLITCTRRINNFRLGIIYAFKYAATIQRVSEQFGNTENLFPTNK